MISHTTRSFRRRLDRLPTGFQEQARKAYLKFRADPHHRSLRFEKLHGSSNLWSVRVTLNYRAVGVREGDAVIWFWIGSHADFDCDFG